MPQLEPIAKAVTLSEPLVLVVLLGTAADPTAESMIATTRRVLGPDAIVLADTSDVRSDQEALAIGERVKARAIARIRWSDGASGVAHLHVHVGPTDGWTDEEISFSPQDASGEKGRTVGYALSSMVQRIEQKQAEANEAAAPSPPPPSSPPLPLPPPSSPPKPSEPPPAASARPIAPARDLDLSVYGIGAIDRVGGPIGASGGLRWWPTRPIGLRGAVGGRTGDLPGAGATTTALFGSAGVGCRTTLGRIFEVGARADVVFYRVSVERRESGSSSTRGRWLGASQLVLEASWAIHPTFGLVMGVGGEIAFGTTVVNVGDATVADVPNARAVAELGARARF